MADALSACPLGGGASEKIIIKLKSFMISLFKDGTLTSKVMCAVLFVVFTFLYLYDYQADILSVTQHVLSGGVTHYNRTIGAVLITIMLILVQIGVAALSKINTYFHALTYWPSLLLLGILTSAGPDIGQGDYPGHWLWLFPLLMAGFVAVVWLCRQYEAIHVTDKSITVLQILWSNMLVMTAMFLITCSIGCTSSVFHYRMHAENAMLSRNYGVASKVGVREEETDSSLTFIRIWALAKQHALGDRLFEYPLVGKSDVMLPNRRSVKLMMVPEVWFYKDLGIYFTDHLSPRTYFEKLHQARRATPLAHDMLLCAYLLDGDLNSFVRTLPRFYKVNVALPKHYREALTLYTHLTNQPRLVYHENVMDTDFEDFQTLHHQAGPAAVRRSNLKDTFGKTYWFYYFILKQRS